ncbi:PilN domain-containing protein [Candidatus Caldatribacterium saccharofermentans]|uniref:PilN domain-containing protein n=1 Tax=Candidatus Caldatribacterium saccharofermentans TaxID=1454753 RepID=A0A7V4THF8_9BACT
MEVKVPYRVTLNLLPRKYIARRTPNWARLFFVVVLLGFSALYLFSYGIFSLRVQSLKQEVITLELRASRLREEVERLKKVQGEVTKIEQRVRLLESLIVREKDWLRFFTILGKHMPQDLALSELRCSSERVECRGQAATVASIADFIGSLSRYRDFFSSVDFTSLALGRDNLYEFGLTMELKSP